MALLVVAAIARRLVPGAFQPHYAAVAALGLLLCSTSWQTAALGATLALLVIFPLARAIALTKADTAPFRAHVLLGTAISLVVACWILVKLSREVAPAALEGTRVSEFVIATIGFSYFVFRAINYLWMHYLLGNAATGSAGPVRLVSYLLFPTTLSAGPIHKWLDYSRELDAQRRLGFDEASVAVERITRGYFYTVVLGRLCYEATRALLDQGQVPHATEATASAAAFAPAHAFHAWESLALLLANHLYLFFDFAGYSSLAIGFGMLLGIKVPENFRLPFLATTMAEFWRNWHITLGDWFRDHVFVPLGGMKRQGLYPALLAALIMFLSGLWHGLVWVFIIWGLWHALMIFIDGAMGLKPIPPADRHGPRYWARLLWTNARVMLGSLLFLPDARTTAAAVLEGFARWN